MCNMSVKFSFVEQSDLFNSGLVYFLMVFFFFDGMETVKVFVFAYIILFDN